MLPAQLGLGDDPCPDKPVTRRKHQTEGFVEDRQCVQLPVIDRQGDQRGVDPVGLELIEQPVGQVLVNDEPQLGMGALERRQQPRQQIRAQGRNDAEIERSGERTRPAPRQRDDRLRLVEHPPGLGDDLLADRRDAERSVRAFEERHAQEFLQLLELGTQGRLADVTGLRRAAEMAEIGECDEITKLLEGHGAGP